MYVYVCVCVYFKYLMCVCLMYLRLSWDLSVCYTDRVCVKIEELKDRERKKLRAPCFFDFLKKHN